MNRNKIRAKNVLYSLLRSLRIPVYILCPVMAILLVFPFSYSYYIQGRLWAGDIIVFISLMHFYTEGFVWKKDGLHREYVRLS